MKLWFERGAWASNRGRRVLAEMSPESVRRVVVIRHAALGDMVLVRPFLVEARKFFPNAEIVLSVVSNYKYGVPYDLVDSVHVLSGSDQRRLSLREQFARAKDLGAVDILFDLADTTRSRYLTWLTNAKVKIGFPYRWYLRNLLFDAAVFRSDFAFEAEVMLDNLKLLGADPSVPLRFEWPEQRVQTSEDSSIETIVYFPFASVQNKCWPKQRFTELIGSLALEFPKFSHVILGGIGADENPEIFKDLATQHLNIKLQQAMDLNLTVNFLSLAKLVISNDTGVRNLAISTNTPTFGLFFATVPYRYWPRWNNQDQAVFLPDGQVPAVAEVLSRLRAILNSPEVEKGVR